MKTDKDLKLQKVFVYRRHKNFIIILLRILAYLEVTFSINDLCHVKKIIICFLDHTYCRFDKIFSFLFQIIQKKKKMTDNIINFIHTYLYFEPYLQQDY